MGTIPRHTARERTRGCRGMHDRGCDVCRCREKVRSSHQHSPRVATVHARGLQGMATSATRDRKRKRTIKRRRTEDKMKPDQSMLERNFPSLMKSYPEYADVLSAVPETSRFSFEPGGAEVLCRSSDGSWVHGPHDPWEIARDEASKLVD